MKSKLLTALALSAFIFAVPGASCADLPPEPEDAAAILPDEDALPAPGVEEESEEEAPIED